MSEPLDDNPQLRKTVDEVVKMISTAQVSDGKRAWLIEQQSRMLEQVGGADAAIYFLDEMIKRGKR